MAGPGEADPATVADDSGMHTRAIRNRKLGLIVVRPLTNGDVDTIAELFDRSDPASLVELATVDRHRHGLVAYVGGDPCPAAFARLARDEATWTRGHVTVAVADRYRGRGVGSTLFELMAADARAAGMVILAAPAAA